MMTAQPPLSHLVNDRFVEQLLASSGPVNIIQAGEQLYKSLRQIRKSSEPSVKKFIFFQQLTPAALYLIEGVAAIIEQQPAKKRQKTLQLCLQICRNLCLGLNSVYQSQDLSEEQKKTAIYLALQMVGQDMLLRYRFQTPASISLWRLSAKWYFFAVKHQFLNDELAIKTPEFLPLKTINTVIKRNILLALSGTDLNDTSDWKQLSDFSAHHAGLIHIASHLQPALFFYWNTVEGFPTQVKSLQQVFSADDILISCQDLINAWQNDRIQLNLPETKRKKLLNHLSGYQKLINDAHPAPPIIFNVSIGFENCCQFLLNRQKLHKIQQLSGQTDLGSGSPAQLDDNFYNLSLSPLDSDRGFIDPNESVDLSDKQTQMSKQKLIPVKFQEAGDAHYFLFEGKDLRINNGDLVVLVNNRNALLAGIVRQQKDLPNFAMRRILIEKIHGELNANTYRQDDNAHSGKAIVLNEATDNAEIFVDDGSLKPFTSISLGQRPAEIGNLHEFTSEFVRFQLTFDD